MIAFSPVLTTAAGVGSALCTQPPSDRFRRPHSDRAADSPSILRTITRPRPHPRVSTVPVPPSQTRNRLPSLSGWHHCTFCTWQFSNRHERSWTLHIPSAPDALPVVLSQDEVARLIEAALIPLHRAVLMTLYAAGLRRAELTHLKVTDIDSKCMVIHVLGGKDRKDRQVMLSPKLLDALRQYCGSLKRKPRIWLFPGGRWHNHRALQHFVLQRREVSARDRAWTECFLRLPTNVTAADKCSFHLACCYDWRTYGPLRSHHVYQVSDTSWREGRVGKSRDLWQSSCGIPPKEINRSRVYIPFLLL